ncbi:MAG: hypothetical protein PWP23_1447 [Candidatus Sumerlaeota bacterium]|nr:hypothetical protein [Candidatus Sumerlaeota bacterium]
MPLSYEDIEKGRRREWKQLMDPEERKRREEEAREKDPEYQKRKSAARRRNDRQKIRDEARETEWQVARRKVMVRTSIAIGILLLILGIQWLAGFLWKKATYDRRAELESVAVSRHKPYQNFSSPLDTWASWRNAWIRLDAEDVVATYSESNIKKSVGKQDPKQYALYLQRRIREGHMNTYVDLAQRFSMPEILRLPTSNPRDGELAVFASQPVKVRGVLNGAQAWVLAVSWDEKKQKWLVEDIRSEASWDPKWSHVNMIQVSKLPRQKPEEE